MRPPASDAKGGPTDLRPAVALGAGGSRNKGKARVVE
jgi:hypothetical protein